MISINYLALYLVILFPFYLIFKEKLTDRNFSKELNECLESGESQETCEDRLDNEEVKIVSALQNNIEMGIVNFSVLCYSLLCELIMICA